MTDTTAREAEPDGAVLGLGRNGRPVGTFSVGVLRRDRRLRLLSLVVATALLSAIAGWIAGRSIRSPEDAARAAQPPKPSAITAPVERRTLKSEIVTRGDVRYAESVDLVVDSDLGTGQDKAFVVTGAVPSVGSELHEGATAVEVSGRPIFVLAGDLPMYRSLRPGFRGEDVRQLEAALQRLTFFGSEPDDIYDKGTEAAVGAWYRASGHEPVMPAEADLRQLREAEDRVEASRRGARGAEAALAEATRPPSQSEVRAAGGRVTRAEGSLARAIAEGGAAVSRASPADRARIEAEQKAIVAQAQLDLEIARVERDDQLAPRPADVPRRAVEDAAAQLSRAEERLSELQAVTGIRIPRGEIVFLPTLPRRIEAVKVRRGAQPSGPVLSLSAPDLQVDSSVSTAERQFVSVGQKVRLDDEKLRIDIAGTVSMIADRPGTDGAATGAHHIRIRPNGTPTEAAGLNLRVTIPVTSTDGEVLAVPLTALSTSADKSSRLTVLGSNHSGRSRRGSTTCADGRVKISDLISR